MMRHDEINDDVIAMLALGETDLPASEVEHVLSCAICSTELESLLRVTRLVRENTSNDLVLETPSPAVWEKIAAEITNEQSDRTATPVSLHRRPRNRRGTRKSQTHPRRTRLITTVGVGSILAIAATFAIFAVLPSIPQTTTLASATLNAFPQWEGAQGEATLERNASGQNQIIVRLAAADADVDTYREVWIMSENLSRLISIGILTGTEGIFTIPSDIDLKNYPVVDISVEPIDDNPQHSGDSIVRGTLS